MEERLLQKVEDTCLRRPHMGGVPAHQQAVIRELVDEVRQLRTERNIARSVVEQVYADLVMGQAIDLTMSWMLGKLRQWGLR